MKSILQFLLIISIVFTGCRVKYSSKIATWIEYEKKESCKYLCHTAKLYLKNNTGNKYYIPVMGIAVTNRLGCCLVNTPYNIRYVNYENMAIEKGAIKEKSCSCKYIGKIYSKNSNLPNNFLKEAKSKELKRFCKKNGFDSTDIEVIKDNSSWVETQYNTRIFFLEPYEECYVLVKYLDLYLKDGKTIKLNSGIDIRKAKKENWSKIHYSGDTVIQYCHDYLPEIAGYKLFKGKIKSNTLIIKDGKVIKNIPRNTGLLKGGKLYY